MPYVAGTCPAAVAVGRVLFRDQRPTAAHACHRDVFCVFLMHFCPSVDRYWLIFAQCWYNIRMKAADLEKALSNSRLDIHTMGLMMFDPVWADRMHMTRDCELLHVISGEVELVTEGSSWTARAGQTLLVPPGTLHRDQFDPDSGLEVFYCSSDWPQAKEAMHTVDNELLLNMPEEVSAQLGQMFAGLTGDIAGGTEVHRMLARSRMTTIMLTVFRYGIFGLVDEDSPQDAAADRRSLRRQQIIEQAKAYLQDHYSQCVSLDEIAAEINVSSYYLSHVFSEESDFSLFGYLTALRMDKARSLLRTGEMNVAEVARAVGYENANYFSRVFKKNCGCSPRDFAASRKA